MKKLTLILVMMPALAFGQFKNPLSLTLYGGTSVAQQNANNQGYWYGLYADQALIAGNGWAFGLAVTASQSHYRGNDLSSKYEGINSNLGGGLFLGKYINYFFPKTDSYLGINSLIRRDLERGEGISPGGTYTMSQEDLLWTGEVNFNLLNRPKNIGDESGYNPNLFPRFQLRVAGQTPLRSAKTDYWNNVPITESLVWSKAALVIEAKQSLYQFGKKTLWEPKLIGGYHYYNGDRSNWTLYGLELGLKSPGKDNWLAINFMVKQQVGVYLENLNSRQFVIGLVFSPSNIAK
ncbi:MAG: hypothetical protein ACOX0C_02620 [Patescibacteria group bacterium]|jgi:hypothetical protein